MYGSIEQYEAQVKKLKEALRFYADPGNWLPGATFETSSTGLMSTVSYIAHDRGDRARKALRDES